MSWVLYNFFIQIYILAFKISALFNSKARKGIIGRQKQLNFPTKTHKRILIHCSSLGEYDQVRMLVKRIKKESDFELFISFFSPSGLENFMDQELVESVFYLPFDSRNKVSQFLIDLDLDLMILVKYEFWWNLIRECNHMNIPLILVAGQFRANQYFFRSFFKTFEKQLRTIEHFFLIDEVSEDVLSSRSFHNTTISGDPRIWSILEKKQSNQKIEWIEDFKGDSRLLIFGSTYAEEQKHIPQILATKEKGWKFIVFPHEINEPAIEKLKNILGSSCCILSKVPKDQNLSSYELVIVDKIGILAFAYRYADIAYIGGGFNHGIHNILEAFVYKIPIIFGPKYEKFVEAEYLSNFDFTRVLPDFSEFSAAFNNLGDKLNDPEIESVYNKLFNKDTSPVEPIFKHIESLLENG